MTDRTQRHDTCDCNQQPRDVHAPDNAIAWVHGYEEYAGTWSDHEGELLSELEMGTPPEIHRCEEERGERYVRGVTGCAYRADVMALRYDIDELRRTVRLLLTGMKVMKAGAESVVQQYYDGVQSRESLPAQIERTRHDMV